MRATQQLTDIGLKATRQRVHVLDHFYTAGHRPVTADELYEALSRQRLDVAWATVYRTLTPEIT